MHFLSTDIFFNEHIFSFLATIFKIKHLNNQKKLEFFKNQIQLIVLCE